MIVPLFKIDFIKYRPSFMCSVFCSSSWELIDSRSKHFYLISLRGGAFF